MQKEWKIAPKNDDFEPKELAIEQVGKYSCDIRVGQRRAINPHHKLPAACELTPILLQFCSYFALFCSNLTRFDSTLLFFTLPLIYLIGGGKHTFWDGGVRVVGFISGGLIPPARRGAVFTGLAHSSDWYATLVVGVRAQALSPHNPTTMSFTRAPDTVPCGQVAGGSLPAHTGLVPPDSVNLWQVSTPSELRRIVENCG